MSNFIYSIAAHDGLNVACLDRFFCLQSSPFHSNAALAAIAMGGTTVSAARYSSEFLVTFCGKK